MNTISKINRNESLMKVDKQTLYRLIKEVLLKGNYTAREIANILFLENKNNSRSRQSVAPRLTELEKVGIVRVVDKRYDSLTGRKVNVYSLADNIEEN